MIRNGSICKPIYINYKLKTTYTVIVFMLDGLLVSFQDLFFYKPSVFSINIDTFTHNCFF